MEKNSELFFQIYSLFLVVALCIVTASGNVVFYYIFLGLVAAMIFKVLYILPVFYISCTSGDFFSVQSDSSISRMLFIIFAIGILFNFIKNNIRFDRLSLFLLFLITFNFFSVQFSVTGSYNSFFLMTQNFFVLFALFKIQTKDVTCIVNLLVFSAIISIFFVVILSMKQGLNVFSLTERYTLEDGLNQNRFAMMLVQMGALAASSIFININKTIKILGFLCYFIALFYIILSGSRSALLASIGSIFIVSFFIYKKKSLLKILLVSVVCSLGYLLWNVIMTFNLPFMERFSIESIINSRGASRFDVQAVVLNEIIPRNFFFGVGFGGENVFAETAKYGQYYASHNMFLDPLAQVGIIGFTLYFGFIFYLLKNSILKYRECKLLYAPLLMIVAAFINGMGENVFAEKYLWFAYALGFFIWNNYFRSKATYGSK